MQTQFLPFGVHRNTGYLLRCLQKVADRSLALSSSLTPRCRAGLFFYDMEMMNGNMAVPQRKDFTVAVVGGGMCGLLTAIGLARAGIEVDIYEATVSTYILSCFRIYD